MKSYSLSEQLAKGQAWEKVLDGYFEDRFRIYEATYSAQRAGWDRMFIDRETGARARVEYKADERAHQTGNAFIETVSVDNADGRRPGWAVTSQADLIFYYVPGAEWELVYVLKPAALHAELARWLDQYPERSVPNRGGYVTRGLLVPLAELERIAQEVISL